MRPAPWDVESASLSRTTRRGLGMVSLKHKLFGPALTVLRVQACGVTRRWMRHAGWLHGAWVGVLWTQVLM